jgi:hypothetical protein
MAIFEQSASEIFRNQEDELIEQFAKETGILSLTDRNDDFTMWNEYAGGGRGFVIQFDAQHDFFFLKSETAAPLNVLRQVCYREDVIEDFWKNPYFLFLVKEFKYSFENEWRMLKSLDQCCEVRLLNGNSIYLVDVPKGLIRSIIFGFNYPANEIDEFAALLLNFDRGIKVQRARVDHERTLVTIHD